MILNNLKISSLSEESIGATDWTSLEGALFIGDSVRFL